MSEKHEDCECSVINIEREELLSIYGTRTVWIAYCGNGPAHGLNYGHYPLYQGDSQDIASRIANEHLQATRHQTYVWAA